MAIKPVSEQLREAVEQCGKTRYRISMETGIPQSVLSRFANRKAGMGWDSIDKLCECIGARLVLEAAPAKVTRRKSAKSGSSKRKGG